MNTGIKILTSMALLFAAQTNIYARFVNDATLQVLEKEVWTFTESRLLELQDKVIRQIQIYPDQAFSYYLLAHLRLREFTNTPEDLAVLKQAAELAEQAIDLDPTADIGYVALAETLDLMGQSKKGIQLLQTAAASGMQPSWRYYFTIARLSADSASKDKVLGLLEQALGFAESQHDIIIPYVIAVFQTTSQGSELVGKLHEWDRKFPNILFKQTIAISLVDSGKYEQAHKIYQHIYTSLPSYNEAIVNDAVLQYRYLKNAKLAVSLFEKVLIDKDVLKNDPELGQLIYSHLGAAYLKLKDFNKAEGTFIAAMHSNSNKVAVLDFIAKNYRESGHSLQLSKLLEKLTLENNPSGLMYAILGETLSEDLRRHDAALESFQNAIILEPLRSDFYTGMGLTYYRMQNQEQALKLFREANRIDPNDATAKYNQACSLSLLGQTDLALTTLQEALALDPRLIENAKSDQDFKSLNANPAFIELVGSGKTKPLPAFDPSGDDEELLGH